MILLRLPSFLSRSGLTTKAACGWQLRELHAQSTSVFNSRTSLSYTAQMATTEFLNVHDPLSRKAAASRVEPYRTVCTRPPWSSSGVLEAGKILAKKFDSAGISSHSVGMKGKAVDIPLVWLRDHCRCKACYNWDTFQKNVDDYSLENLAVKESSVDGDILSVTWQDGHISKYSVGWLADNFCSGCPQIQRFLWDGPRMTNEPLPTTPFDLHMKTDEGLKNTLSSMIKYGFCIVNGAPATVEGTEQVTSRISFPLETVYGRVVTMTSGEMSHSDTSYTTISLGAHHDTTYLTVPAGIQVFHCLERNGEGGKTLLADGFRVAEELRQRDPASFRCLATTPVPHEFKEGSHYHLYSTTPVLTTDMSGQLIQMRFNPYDRAPLRTVKAEDVGQFYSSYEALTRIVLHKDTPFWIQLEPGMVLLVDNWRVMHGRSAYSGRRVMCIYYLPRDDWTSRARVMGLM